jgi:hypothetical protein
MKHKRVIVAGIVQRDPPDLQGQISQKFKNKVWSHTHSGSYPNMVCHMQECMRKVLAIMATWNTMKADEVCT